MRWFIGAYGLLVAATMTVWAALPADTLRERVLSGVAIGLPGFLILVAWIIAIVECPGERPTTGTRRVMLAISILSIALYLFVLFLGTEKLLENKNPRNWGMAIFLLLSHGPQYILCLMAVAVGVGSTWFGNKASSAGQPR